MDEFIVSQDNCAINDGDSVMILKGPCGVDDCEEFEGQVGVVVRSGNSLVCVSACRKGTNLPEEWVYLRRDLAKKLPICAAGEDIEMSEFINSF